MTHVTHQSLSSIRARAWGTFTWMRHMRHGLGFHEAIPHRFQGIDYEAVPNPAAKDRRQRGHAELAISRNNDLVPRVGLRGQLGASRLTNCGGRA